MGTGEKERRGKERGEQTRGDEKGGIKSGSSTRLFFYFINPPSPGPKRGRGNAISTWRSPADGPDAHPTTPPWPLSWRRVGDRNPTQHPPRHVRAPERPFTEWEAPPPSPASEDETPRVRRPGFDTRVGNVRKQAVFGWTWHVPSRKTYWKKRLSRGIWAWPCDEPRKRDRSITVRLFGSIRGVRSVENGMELSNTPVMHYNN